MLVEHIGTFGGDLLVVNAARVSFDRWADELKERDVAIIKRLANDGHISPFYHPQTTIRVTAPIFVANQLKRHQVGFALNEVSRRYTSRNVNIAMPDLGGETRQVIAYEVAELSMKAYERLLFDGVPKEVARAVLPMATETTWLWTGSLYAYANLCRQRLAEDAQSETRLVAVAIANIMLTEYPVSWPALMDKMLGNDKGE